MTSYVYDGGYDVMSPPTAACCCMQRALAAR